MARIAAVQTGGGYWDTSKNVERAVSLLREAAEHGGQILCLPETFNTLYFSYEEDGKYFSLAETIPGLTTDIISQLARETHTVIICLVFEKTMKEKSTIVRQQS